ncbi:hypothetical protein SLEP1_g9091 [Rubroshorea leprosula]|uniref:ATPase, vacuolar ER assembly factor, Vma12 n=1 Tax=Rubroshorea leprosula TaxID=152421 RepID=A0AAV5I8C4_9ROSI|nr:hypothetical protein SLEP1_g9091 [Rubroshorea leprosula]
MNSGNPHGISGLAISVTESIRSFFLSASWDPHLPLELRGFASNLSSQSNVTYKQLRNIWINTTAESRSDFRQLFSASDFVFSRPKSREKSEELKARLRKLAELGEFKDIAPKKNMNEPFSTYKDQLGFGFHVVLTMFTGYLVGYLAFRALFNHSPVMNAAGGIMGLVFGMLLETLLFIIRTSDHGLRSPPPTSRMKKNQ